VVLELSNNGLDDDKLRMLASGLADNISVTHLNLSHNRISDRCEAAPGSRLQDKAAQLAELACSSWVGCVVCSVWDISSMLYN
jgi:hypothetical protein